MSNEESWKISIGITEGCTEKKVSVDFLSLVLKEIAGEITNDDIKKELIRKYSKI